MNYIDEINKTAADIESISDDFRIALLSDSHLSDFGPDTAKHIKAIDKTAHFDCMVHCGNILNGDNPRKISMEILQEELDMYRSSVECGVLLPVQGENDGWRNERCLGQLTTNIMTDEVWDKQLKMCLRGLNNIKRPKKKPYYYMDFPKKNVRIIVLCSYIYDGDEDFGVFEKYRGFSVEQLKWLKNEALKTDKTVLVFSSTLPKSRFETGNDPYIYKGRSTESNLMIFQDAKRNGTDIAAWIVGGYGFDEAINVGGINFVTINTQLAKNRDIKDCWDGVVLNKKERKLHFCRFGYGEDRCIEY